MMGEASQSMAQSRHGTTTRFLERVSTVAWRLATSPRSMMVLLVVLLGITLLGGILPQVNPATRQDAAQYAQWLSQMRLRWSGTLSLFDSLGLLNIFSGRFFHLVLAILLSALFLQVLIMAKPAWGPPPSRHASVRVLSLPSDVQRSWERLAHALAAVGQRLVQGADGEQVRYGVAVRAGVYHWLPSLLYVGLALLFAASWVQWRYGWIGPSQELMLGEIRPLDRTTGLAVRLEQVEIVPRRDGTLARLGSRVSLLKGTEVQGDVALGPGKRAIFADLALYQLGFGPSIRISARDAEGQRLDVQRMVGDTALQRSLRMRFEGRQQEQLLAIPKADVLVYLVHYPALPAQGIPSRALQVQLRRGGDGQLLAEQFLAEGGQVQANGVSVDIAFEYYILARAAREPGLPLAGIGGALIFLGMASFLPWPSRTVWVAVRQDGEGSACQLVVPRIDAEAPWFRALNVMLTEESYE
jgi:hypothetical protein